MKNSLNILYTCDNDFLEITSISMASVIKNNADVNINFYLATESCENDKYKKLVNFYKNDKNVSIFYVDCQKYDNLLAEKKFDKWGSKSYYVYWKMFAYEDLEIDNIWYLDSDVICLNKIENPILEESKAIGGVLDSAHACFNKCAHMPNDYYFFNSGALFINVKKWKNNNCEKKIVRYILDIKYKPLMCDQDILAMAIQNDFQVLDPKYCYFSGYDYYGINNSYEMYSLNKRMFYLMEEIENAKNNVIFYHCLGGVFGRPWEDGNYSPIKKEYLYYRSLSAWPNFCKKRNISFLFKIEKALEILPKPIYNKIHNFAVMLYTKRMASK